MKPKPTNSKSPPARPPPTHEQITQRAHRLWIEEGRPEGRHRQHWSAAEAQLRAGLTSADVEAEKRLDGMSKPASDGRTPKGENL